MSGTFWALYYEALEGATILKFVEMRGDEFGGSNFPVFLVKFSDGSTGEIEISQDEEAEALSLGFPFLLDKLKSFR